MNIGFWISLVMLGCNSVQDLRKREIFPCMTLAVTAAGVVWMAVREGVPFLMILAALSPGFLMLGLSMVTREQIGYGDGIAVLGAGAWIGFPGILYVAAAAFFLAAGAAVILLAIRNKNRSIPLLPYLLAGELILLVLR